MGLDIQTHSRSKTPDAVPFTAEESIAELAALAASAGASVKQTIIQSRPKADAATLIGSGKLDELRAAIFDAHDACALRFNDWRLRMIRSRRHPLNRAKNF